MSKSLRIFSTFCLSSAGSIFILLSYTTLYVDPCAKPLKFAKTDLVSLQEYTARIHRTVIKNPVFLTFYVSAKIEYKIRSNKFALFLQLFSFSQI